MTLVASYYLRDFLINTEPKVIEKVADSCGQISSVILLSHL